MQPNPDTRSQALIGGVCSPSSCDVVIGRPRDFRGLGAPGAGYRSTSSESNRVKPSRSRCRTMLVDFCSSALSSWAS